MSRDLSWSNHVNAIVNKAKKVVGLLKRTVGSKNREIFSMLYKSLFRPILEYACPVWSPYLVKDKLAIEKVQRRASRIALGQKLREMSYEERCILLNWNTLCLQHRREYLKLTPLSTPSSWESSKTGTVCQTISSRMKLTSTNFKKCLKRWMKIYWHRSSYFNWIYFHFKYHSYYTI